MNERGDRAMSAVDLASPTDPAAAGGFFGGRAWLVECPRVRDERGVLQPFDFARLPFVPCRSFVVTDVPAGVVRGGHAHRAGLQMLVCVCAIIELAMRWRGEVAVHTLTPHSAALVFEPGVWCQQKYLVAGSVLLVFGSTPYDPDSCFEDGARSTPT